MLRKNSDCYVTIMEQVKDVERCFIKFEAFMHTATSPDHAPTTMETLFQDVASAEDVADKSLRAMIESTSKAGYLPSTREDLIAIATSCDKIANTCEHVAYLIMMYGVKLPDFLAPDFTEIFNITENQLKLLESAIGMMFSKMNAFQKDHSILDEIRALETQVDKLENKIGHCIFAMDIELAAKMQIFGLVEEMCDISDIIEDIADKLQIMLISRKA